ncbi:MAG: hypothetical protein IKL25_11285, partial [Clostridia bacterium]|nr:hypothetical protein [Clostridia bacterium]
KGPMYVLMGLDVLGRIILIVKKVLDRDAYMLVEIILGLIVSIGVLAITVYMFRQPEKTVEAQVL